VILKERLKINTARYWEVDTVRGVAIILMVYYHLMWDLNFFGVVQINMLSGPWQWFARGIATMFISVMGISLVLSYNRARAKMKQGQLFQKYLRRGGKIFGLGLVITLGTYLFLDFQGGRGFVIFGILHLIGFSIAAAYPFLPYRRRWISLMTGLVFIGLGVYLEGQVSLEPWLIWLGVKQAGRLMVDYYPVLPWFGVALLGIFLGYALYPGGVARFQLPNEFDFPMVQGLSFLGQHSLVIYVVHQPILMAILFALGVGSI
jgi:uncharacterized membrane protein